MSQKQQLNLTLALTKKKLILQSGVFPPLEVLERFQVNNIPAQAWL
jgi:hypothetical protein